MQQKPLVDAHTASYAVQRPILAVIATEAISVIQRIVTTTAYTFDEVASPF